MTRPETTRLVMKFGGTSMGDLERIRRAARIVAAEAASGKKVAVVVSAMAGKTNELVAWTDGAPSCHRASPLRSTRRTAAPAGAGEAVLPPTERSDWRRVEMGEATSSAK